MGINSILTGSNMGDLADTYQGLQSGLWAASLLFLLLSILLFVKFDLKNYFSVIMKHNQKRVSEKYRPQNVTSPTKKTRKTGEVNRKTSEVNRKTGEVNHKTSEVNHMNMATEQLSSEMTALLEPEQETELLSEEQFVFTMGTSVELYTEVLDEKNDKV